MEKKICSICGIEKFLHEYQKNKYSKTGYRSECSECSKEKKKKIPKEKLNLYHKKFRELNRDKLNKKQREYYKNNIEKERERRKKYKTISDVQTHKKETEPSLSWKQKNKEIFNQRRRERYKYDILYKLSINVRNRLNSYVSSINYRKKSKTFKIIGCTPLELKEHIENLFCDGMSWDNKCDWHIDHKIPLSHARSEEELYTLSHYSNLQPLWASENLKKKDKIKL
jgi:hypothetical protein